MEQLRKFYESVLTHKTLKSEVSRAKEAFEPKPFVAEYRKLKLLCVTAYPVFSAFSILTGVTFLYFLFASQLHPIIGGILAVLILLLMEVAKGFFVKNAAKKAFLKSKQVVFFVVFALPLFACSVFLSVSGTEQLYTKLDTSQVELQTNFTTQKDSITRAYDSLTLAENNDFAAFKASVTWQGKINIYDKAVKGRVTANTERLKQYQTDKEKALVMLQSQHQKAQTQNETKSGFERTTWIAISTVNECMIVLCLLGLVWYQYRVSMESEALTRGQDYIFTNDQLQALIQNLFLQNSTLPTGSLLTNQSDTYAPVGSPSIGFKFGGQNSEKQPVQQGNGVVTNGVVNRLGTGVCPTCEERFTLKTWNHKYCSEPCRVTAWEKRTGRKLKKGN